MDLCDRNTIKALLARHGFHFSKSLGQNFLIAPWVPEEIAAASGAGPNCAVLEIGPGIGPLTAELCRRAGRVVAVELDQRLVPVLQETMAAFDNFTLVSGDILRLDLPALVRERMAGYTPLVCANLPYNITTPILTALVEARCFDTITVMIQKEVAVRLAGGPGGEYGAFSVFMQFYTQPEVLFDVPPECFLPEPKVTSTVLRCRVRRQAPVDLRCSEPFFFRTVRAAFALRRKTLVNSLASVFGGELSREELAQAVESCGLVPSIRGEKLGLEEFAALANILGDRLAEK